MKGICARGGGRSGQVGAFGGGAGNKAPKAIQVGSKATVSLVQETHRRGITCNRALLASVLLPGKPIIESGGKELKLLGEKNNSTKMQRYSLSISVLLC